MGGEELLLGLRRNDSRAFAMLYRTYRRLIWSVLRRMLPDDPEVEDLVQIAFLEIFRSLHRYEGRATLQAWLVGVALNVGRRHRRRRRTGFDDVGEDVLAPEPDPEGALIGNQAAERSAAILESMSEAKRTVFILADFLGWTRQEIALLLAVNPSTVTTRLFYARREFWRAAAGEPALAHLVPAGTEWAHESRARRPRADLGPDHRRRSDAPDGVSAGS
jgi:RNA polymerase sigma-70 factor (ECF subfamily)